MKRKHKKLPGVTLIELIIVLAIFSGIAVGAIAMVRPVLTLHRRTVSQEKAIASIDSIGRYIQDNLRYADNIMIYRNTGISDIGTFIDFPFDYHAFDIKYPVQKGTNIYESDERISKSVSISPNTTSTLDPYHYANPVSYFVQYHYTESICYPKFSEKSDKEKKACDDYFSDKIVYVMQIKEDTGEVDIYGYPLTSPYEERIYLDIIEGTCKYKPVRGLEPIHNSVSTDFSDGDIKIEEVIMPGGTNFPGDAAGGMRFKFKYSYQGATQLIEQNYEISVNFLNAVLKKSHEVNDLNSYTANTFEYFDCEGKNIKCHGENGKLDTSYVASGADAKTTYIVYSLPEIVIPNAVS